MKPSVAIGVICLTIISTAVAGSCYGFEPAGSKIPESQELSPIVAAQTELIKHASSPKQATTSQPETETRSSDVPEPIPHTAELIVEMEEVYFGSDSAFLSERARETVRYNIELMKHDPAMTVRIEGHCDQRGPAEYNLELGERRARAVQRYMISSGVAKNRISVVSYGKTKPIVVGPNNKKLVRNRRVEFVVTTDEKK